MNKSRKISIFLVAVLLVCSISVGAFSYYIAPVNAQDQETTTFSIIKGQSADEILSNLQKNKLIKSKGFAKIYLKFNETNFIPGVFQIKKSNGLPDIFEILSTNDQDSANSVLFLEGYRVIDFAREAEKKLGIPKQSFLEACNNQIFIDKLKTKYELIKNYDFNPKAIYQLEGLLAPDTYNLVTVDDAETLIDILVGQSNERYLANKPLFDKSNLSLNQIYTLASMAEAEAKTYDDRVLVSSIFMHRIENGYGLGSDVTTYYGLQVDMASRDLTKAELAKDDGYNTRAPKKKGLPVGPINSPNNESVLAALNYTPTKYYFFVSDKNGKMYAATNYTKHKQIIDKLKEDNLWFTY